MKIIKRIKWDGKLKTFMLNMNGADIAINGLRVDYPNKFSNHPRLTDPVTLYVHNKKVPVGATLEKTDRAQWLVRYPER